jgi:hypothetical protein
MWFRAKRFRTAALAARDRFGDPVPPLCVFLTLGGLLAVAALVITLVVIRRRRRPRALPSAAIPYQRIGPPPPGYQPHVPVQAWQRPLPRQPDASAAPTLVVHSQMARCARCGSALMPATVFCTRCGLRR